MNRTFFVLLDEAMGKVEGALDLHFQLAPGKARIEVGQHWATTAFEDSNVLVWMSPQAPVSMAEEEGWFAWKYGHRQPRKAFRYRHSGTAPAAFLTLVLPYRGGAAELPKVSAALPEAFEVGADRVQLQVEALGKVFELGRELKRRLAWCKVVGESKRGKR